MLELILETLSWGVSTALMSTFFCIIFEVKLKNLKQIILISTIYGLVRGYTGKSITELFVNKYYIS